MEEIKQKASWVEEFDKFVEKGYKNNFGLSSTNRLNWGCEECGGQDAENDIKDFISQALQKRDEAIIKMLENTDVQMSVNGDVSKDEIAMAKFIYKAHIKHIIKKIESAIIPPNSINGTLPSETDSATK